MLVLAACVASGAEIDYGAVSHPDLMRLADRSAETRWRALFDVDVEWPARQIAYLSERLPDQAPTLLSARLLYAGEPWVRRTGDQGNLRRWKASDLETKQAVLREMRALREPAFADVLAYHLGQETDPTLVASSLVTLWTIDQGRAVALAIRLADPRSNDKLPGSAIAGVRQDALRFLVGTRGVDASESRRALQWALLEGRSAERLHAISQMPVGGGRDLVRAAILVLAPRHQELDPDDRASLITACTRLSGEVDPELVGALVTLAVEAQRDVAVPAATALASNVTWRVQIPLPGIAKRAREDADATVRHALSNLLLRVNAQASDLGAGSPWSRLSRHRERLSKWEWEQFVK